MKIKIPLCLIIIGIIGGLCAAESTNVFQVYEKYTPQPYGDGDYDETTASVTEGTEHDEELDLAETFQDEPVDKEAAIEKTEAEIKKITRFLPEGYDAAKPPSDEVNVECSVIVFNIRDINEFTRDFNLEINLRLYWVDDRLEHLQAGDKAQYVVLNSKQLKDIWTPDLFIDHAKTVTQPVLVAQPSSLRIYHGSIVRWSARQTVRLSCKMDFSYYPADTQKCAFELRSFNSDHKQMNLLWRHEKRYRPRLIRTFNLSSYEIGLPSDSVEEYIDKREEHRQHSVLKFEIHIRRKMYFHLLQTYLPSTLFIIISWLSFLIIPSNVSARMTICMSTLLNLSYMFAGVRQGTPNDSYAKALDVWMIACIFVVFLALLEYAVVLKLNSMKVKKKPKKNKDESSFLGGLKMNLNFERLKASDMSEGSTITPISYSSWYYIDPKEYVPYQIRRPKLRNSRHESSLNGSGSGASSESSPSPVPPPVITSANPSPQLALKAEEDDNNGKCDDRYKLIAKRLEWWAWRTIPSIFIAFNIVYWPFLLIRSEYYRDIFT